MKRDRVSSRDALSSSIAASAPERFLFQKSISYPAASDRR